MREERMMEVVASASTDRRSVKQNFPLMEFDQKKGELVRQPPPWEVLRKKFHRARTEIFGRNLFWYAAVFGTVTAISRAVITDELQARDPEGAMSLVVQNTHYMPKKWRGRENSDAVRAEFETLFQYTGMMLLEEMASIFVTPYLLIFVVPKHVDDILQFISNFTVYVHGVGDVCSFSSFDFQNHGNRNYASPSNAEQDKSSQGKMEKSFLSFKSTYPYWEPDMHGHQFLSNLHKFRERQTHLAYSRAIQDNTSDHPWDSMFRWNDKRELTQRFLSREVQQNTQGMSPRHNLDYLLSMNPSQRTHPYILDWYYTTILLNPASISTDFHPSAKEEIARPSDSMWSLQNKQLSEIVDTAWQSQFSDRLQSHMEASTSRPLFREDYDLRHPVLEPHNMNHWWNRSGPQLSVPQTSFMEPPTFGEQHLNFHHDNGSERSEEQAKSDVAADDEWEAPNSMFKTMYINNSDNDEAFNLHFTDEIGQSSIVETTNHDVMPSVSIPVRIIPSSNDPVWFRGK
ncbi:hypothetical protein ZIOFF_064232 [Zingiber officinale]|uniref:Autophagy-related protein 9 n=1 Tax=Zingiber officinale TaxID=94328 RepID=A0A8J5C8Z7_ZINOF|nr:hypothetical protein ZIOFF_064232 [Zingiber officinale]